MSQACPAEEEERKEGWLRCLVEEVDLAAVVHEVQGEAACPAAAVAEVRHAEAEEVGNLAQSVGAEVRRRSEDREGIVRAGSLGRKRRDPVNEEVDSWKDR